MNNPVIIGRIGRPYGVKGWLHITSFTDPIDNICNFQQWHLSKAKHGHAYTVTQCKPHQTSFVVKLNGVNDRDAASLLTNADISVERSELPTPATDEYYWHDLIGLTVINHDGTELGKIIELMATGANDVIVVGGKKRVLIPYLSSTIIAVNLETKTVNVKWDVELSE